MTAKLLLTAIICSAALTGSSAQALSTSLVIAEVYGGGGNASAPYANDFIELRNVGTTPVALSGWSVQYASAAGGTWAVTALPDVTLSAGKFFLIQQSSGGANGSPLPAPDATGAIALAATAGKVAVVSSTAALSGVCPPGAVDLVGYGTANCFEGTGPAPAPSNTLSAQRGRMGRAETDDNSADFTALAPEPQNTSSPTAVSVRSLTARSMGRGVVLRWQTATEVGLTGFDVYRLRAGVHVKLNARLIEASGGVAGRAYRYRIRPMQGVTYALRALERDGRRSWFAFSPL